MTVLPRYHRGSTFFMRKFVVSRGSSRLFHAIFGNN